MLPDKHSIEVRLARSLYFAICLCFYNFCASLIKLFISVILIEVKFTIVLIDKRQSVPALMLVKPLYMPPVRMIELLLV